MLHLITEVIHMIAQRECNTMQITEYNCNLQYNANYSGKWMDNFNTIDHCEQPLLFDFWWKLSFLIHRVNHWISEEQNEFQQEQLKRSWTQTYKKNFGVALFKSFIRSGPTGCSGRSRWLPVSRHSPISWATWSCKSAEWTRNITFSIWKQQQLLKPELLWREPKWQFHHWA